MLWVLFFKMDGPLLYCQRALNPVIKTKVLLTAKFWVKGAVDELMKESYTYNEIKI